MLLCIILDQVYENSTTFLEQGLMVPVLVMLSIWSIGGADRLYGFSGVDRHEAFEQNAVEFHRLQASSYRYGLKDLGFTLIAYL